MKQRWCGCVIGFCSLLGLLSSCSTISGIGHDNAPLATPLAPFTPTVGLTQKWVAKKGCGSHSTDLKLNPAFIGSDIVVPDEQGGVYAFNKSTGLLHWEVSTSHPISTGVAAGLGRFYVGTRDAKVMGLSPANGALQWTQSVSNQVLATPAIGSRDVIAKTIDGKLCALNASSGQIRWCYDHGSSLFRVSADSAPFVAHQTIIAGFSDGKLASYRLNDGSVLWERPITLPSGSFLSNQLVDIEDPHIEGDTIYVATYQGNVSAIECATGNIKWQQPKISSFTGLALTPRVVIVADGEGAVWALDKITGEVLWKQTELQYRNVSRPATLGPWILVGDGEGYLHVLSAKNGCIVGRVLVNKKDPIMVAPLVDASSFYVYTQSGKLICFQLSP